MQQHDSMRCSQCLPSIHILCTVSLQHKPCFLCVSMHCLTKATLQQTVQVGALLTHVAVQAIADKDLDAAKVSHAKRHTRDQCRP